MKLNYIITNMFSKNELTHDEHHQLINYIDNSQDWNIQLLFQLLCKEKYNLQFNGMSARAILDELTTYRFITILDNK